MYLKIHATGQRYGHRFVVAVCDKSLIGKKLRDKEKNIEIEVSERFYKGEEKTEEEVIKILKDATNINLIGEEAVNAGLKAEMITEENIIMIKGVPHAQFYSLD